MRIVIAPDSFKECLSATSVAAAISAGVKKVNPEAEMVCIPVADGGEGTVEAIVSATNGIIKETASVDALNRPIRSFYGILDDGKTAVIEMAAASGIELIIPQERNPLITSTYGTGLLLKAAIDNGFKNIILAIGGSATNDGGAGMAQALGFDLQDKNEEPIGLGGGSLADLYSIDSSHVHPLLSTVKITIACDVRNSLLGTSGATLVYGPQKGATPPMLDILEENMAHFSSILQQKFGTNFAEIPGSGAAGGLGAGLLAFCKAQLISGFELINQLTHLEDQISRADLVFTAEGRIDSQTAFGKTISGVAQLGKKYQVPVIALAGKIEDDLTRLYSQGITAVFAIGDRPMSLDESKERAAELLAGTVEQLMRILSVSAKK
ncbi:MAG TPA: glycerate kinase [Prolixibacteraceae bacterium]|nr:glycerate kinase [Prolixibacteraceae bacterium]